MNKFFDKLPLGKLMEAKISAKAIAKFPILGKAIQFTNHIVCVLAILLLAACFSGSKSDKGATSGTATSNSPAVQAVPAQTSGSGMPNSESDFIVSLTDDGKGAIITGYVGKSNTVHIPAKIQDMPIKIISYNVFRGKNISSVIIPEGVERIEYGVFGDCKRLSSVTLPSTLLYIGECAFEGCEALKTINLPAGLEKIGNYVFQATGLTSFPNPWPANITAIPDRTFGETKLRGSLVIPEGIISIGEIAFTSCKELTSVSLPSTIKKIERYAFGGCTNLTTVNIPESVVKIDFYISFEYCPKLSLASQAALKQRGYKDF